MADWLFFPDENVPVPAAMEEWSFSATPVETWGISQATGGYGRGADGRWVLFAPNMPRTYFDPITLEDRGVLLEPESYQTVFRPRMGAVSLTNITRTDLLEEPSPFGNGVASLAATAIQGNHAFNLLSGTGVAEHIQDGTDVTAQWIIKPNGINRFTMFCQRRDASYASVNFDMRESGSVSALVGCSATIERDVLGYYRMSMTVNSLVGSTILRFGGQMALDDGVRGFLGDGVQGFHVAYWGIERGITMTSPSAANGNTATTRAADIMTSSVPWIGTGPKSFGIEFTPLTNHDQTIFEAGLSDTMTLRVVGGAFRYTASTAGESVAFLSGPASPPGIPKTVVVTAGFNEFLLAHNGSLLGADTAGTAPSAISTMRVGGTITGAEFKPIAVKTLKFWNHALNESSAVQYSKELKLSGEQISETEITVQSSIAVPPDQNTVSFLVSLSQKDLAAKVNYRTISDSAIAGVDFIDSTGTLEFIFGELYQIVTVQLGARADVDRSFKFELNSPSNATIDNSTCLVTLQRAIRILPVTSMDVLFGETVGSSWTLTRPTPAPRRRQDGIWELVAAHAPAHSWIHPSYNSGVIIDALGHDQCLFDSALPVYLDGMTQTIDLTTQTMVGTRSVVVTETATTAVHSFTVPITLGYAATETTPAIPATADVPTGDFTVWLIVKPVGRTSWAMDIKGRDNIWSTFKFSMTGDGTATDIYQNGAWGAIERDAFFPDCYRISIGRTQGVYAGVDAEFSLIAIDAFGNRIVEGNASNSLRIIHMQVESRIGWGSPLVTAAATTKSIRAQDDLRPNGTWFKRNNYSIGIILFRMSEQPPIQRVIHMRDAVPMKDDYGYYVNNGVGGVPNTTGATYNGIIPGFQTSIKNALTVIFSSDPANRFALFQDGGKAGEQSLLGKIPPNAVDSMRIGSRLDGVSLQACSIFLQRIRYWEGALTDYEGTHFSKDLHAEPPPPPPIPPLVFLPSELRIREGSILSVPITKNGKGACSVTYTTKAGSAKYAQDYLGVGPVVMEFGEYDTVKYFTVQTSADSISDHGETFTVELSNFSNCIEGVKVCVVTITEPPQVSVPLSASVPEGGVLTLNVLKTGEGACSVAWETKQSKAGMVGIDYTGVGSPPVVINFGEFETSKSISVTTLQDTISDPNEVFTIVLSGEVNCSVGNRTCTVTITDDEISTSGIYKRAVTFAGGVNGGIGKTVYRVTSLADDGKDGTLRYGINLGSRHIIFEVGGVIQMTQDWTFTKSDVYISGETAPYPGITLRGNATKGGNVKPQASKRIVFSHINFERCHDARVVTNSNGDAVELAPGAGLSAEDIWFRHCSFFWSNDEIVSVWATGEDSARGSCNRISFSDCLFAEPLYRPEDLGYRAHYENGSVESNHNYGVILGVNSYNVDFQYCMFTDIGMRGPFIDGGTSVVLANNIALNSNKGAHVSVNNYDSPLKPFKVTCVGYLAISGPSTTASDFAGFKIHSAVVKTPPTGSVAWVDGLYSIKGDGAYITPKTTVAVTYESTQRSAVVDISKVDRPIDIPGAPVEKLSQDEIIQRIQDNIGPFPRKRIPNLARKIEHLKGRTGKFVNHESEVGGPTSFGTTEYKRALNGSTKFDDGTTIPAYPVLPATPTATDIKKVREWLDLFLAQIQYD